MKTRKIPATMVTQHPDNAAKPYWHYKTYISTQYEADEAYRSFSQLGATEYKWDWEGKLVDESVLERFFGEHFDFFSKQPLGRERFLTYRLPNPRVEHEFRLGRAFMNMASAASVAKHFGVDSPPLFEVILPMTETAEEMLALQEAYVQIHELTHPLYKLDRTLKNLRVIPLFESVSTIIQSDKILEKYLLLYKKRFKKQPPYMRPYVARSDPALNSGHIATILAIKIALSRYKQFAEARNLPLYPIVGTGSLPFRGGLNPENIQNFMNEYKGIRTATLQSAFRYDYPLDKVIAAVSQLEENLVKNTAGSISPKEEKQLLNLIDASEKNYKSIIEQIAPVINQLAPFIPARRERFQHVGLFGYSRGEKGIKLPRAITFTATLYSLGIPPELIGTGRTLAYAQKANLSDVLNKYYVNLHQDLLQAGKFVNKDNISKLAKTSNVWKEILEDIGLTEKYLNITFDPATEKEKKHHTLTKKILNELPTPDNLSHLIKKAAMLRKSLG